MRLAGKRKSEISGLFGNAGFFIASFVLPAAGSIPVSPKAVEMAIGNYR
jgi:hypothetical protein